MRPPLRAGLRRAAFDEHVEPFTHEKSLDDGSNLLAAVTFDPEDDVERNGLETIG